MQLAKYFLSSFQLRSDFFKVFNLIHSLHNNIYAAGIHAGQHLLQLPLLFLASDITQMFDGPLAFTQSDFCLKLSGAKFYHLRLALAKPPSIDSSFSQPSALIQNFSQQDFLRMKKTSQISNLFLLPTRCCLQLLLINVIFLTITLKRNRKKTK